MQAQADLFGARGGQSMNRHVNAIAGRLSLRPPQRRSLEILDRITEIVAAEEGHGPRSRAGAIRSEFPTVTDFEREFPSLCFALATGVGKTRLMGAFISLPASGAWHQQFLRAGSEPDDLQQADRGLHAEHAEICVQGHRGVRRRSPPVIITGETTSAQIAQLVGQLFPTHDQIFNISKINSEVRGGRSPTNQAASGIHRRELFRLSGRAARPGAHHG